MEKKYKKCDMKLDKYCGLPCPDITDDGYCKLQPLVDDKKGWKVGSPITYSEMNEMIKLFQDKISEPEHDEETAKKISDAHELAKKKAGKVEMTRK